MADPVLVPAQPTAPPATVDPHPLVPVIKDAIDDLAKSPPGPVADAKAANLTALIGVLGDVLANPAVGAAASSIFAALPVGARAWVLIAAAGLALAGGGFSLGRYTSPSPYQVQGCQCGCVTTGKCVCKDCDHPQLKKTPSDQLPPVPPSLARKSWSSIR